MYSERNVMLMIVTTHAGTASIINCCKQKVPYFFTSTAQGYSRVPRWFVQINFYARAVLGCPQIAKNCAGQTKYRPKVQVFEAAETNESKFFAPLPDQRQATECQALGGSFENYFCCGSHLIIKQNFLQCSAQEKTTKTFWGCVFIKKLL